jgi:hypothetical protein|tara:strand:- start:5574 stop:6488 length:915 start_codon:yes stop_codon:yes gene_type:complete
MDNLNILVEAKREYLGQLCLLMCPVMIETFEEMYEEAYKLSKGRKVLVMYQKLLKEVPNWSDAMSKQHTDNIANRCAWFNDLLAAVFVSCVKILSAVRLSKDNKKISLKLPTNEVFIQMCHNKVAESLYNDPYIYHDSQNEHARNDKLFERFSVCVENSVKELIPVQQILQTYMSQQEGQDLDLGEAEIGDSEDPDIIEDNGMEETTEEPFDNEQQMEGEPMMEEPMGGEPMMEEPMGSEPMMEEPMGGEPMMEERNNSSFMNNEFRTINTAPQSQKPMQRTQDDDGVFFPDAAESRQKNIMYK